MILNWFRKRLAIFKAWYNYIKNPTLLNMFKLADAKGFPPLFSPKQLKQLVDACTLMIPNSKIATEEEKHNE